MEFGHLVRHVRNLVGLVNMNMLRRHPPNSRTEAQSRLMKRMLNGLSTYAELVRRVRELETQLYQKTSSVSEQPPHSAELVDTHNELSIDSIATNAFDEVPKEDIGHFGKLFFASQVLIPC